MAGIIKFDMFDRGTCSLGKGFKCSPFPMKYFPLIKLSSLLIDTNLLSKRYVLGVDILLIVVGFILVQPDLDGSTNVPVITGEVMMRFYESVHADNAMWV